MRKDYRAPLLTRVQLRAEEAVLTGCKDAGHAYSAAPDLVGTLGCSPPGFSPACREVGS